MSGQGNGGGWPSTSGNASGGGRSNNTGGSGPSGPSGGASKPRAAKGAFGMAPDKTPRRGAGMAGGNMFTPAHDLNRPGGGMGARRGRR